MHLKSLELFGFKSFADKTRLDFESGTTAVVGPNGCGKSNIVDAVRWCLGEQSAKSMRSNQMLDVIFGGSETRQTTGICEVSLTFDNSQNMLPIDYSEVEITRRLFRSGESEYFINKSQCRLKDIRDLFLDTGIGSEGYSVIEQGRVEFIISAKPEERREMFEEAAGVSKYKVRREETLRKLEKVELDMSRINDMLLLLKEQITSLDIAAKKARQYQKSKDELKGLEVASVVHNIISNQKEIGNVKSALEPKEKQFEILNAQQNKTDAVISESRFLLTQKDELYIKLQEEFSQLKSGISLADEKIRQSAQRQEEAQERKVGLAGEIRGREEKIKGLGLELEALAQAITELASNVSKCQKQYDDKEAEAAELRNRLSGLSDHAGSMRSKLASVEEKKDKLGTEHLGLKSILATLQAQEESLSAFSKEIYDQSLPFVNEVTAKEKSVESLKAKVSALESNYESYKGRINDLKSQIEQSYQQQVSIKEKIVSVHTKRQTLQEWENKDPVRTAINSLKSNNFAGIRGPVSGLMRITPGMEEAIASALGEKLDYMISDSAHAAENAIKYLQENNFGCLTFLVLERIPKKGPLSFFSQGQSKNSAVSMIECDESLKEAFNFLCADITIENGIVYNEAFIRGGGKAPSEKPLLLDVQYSRLDAEMKTDEGKLAEADSQNNLLKEKLSRLEAESVKKYDELEKSKLELELASHGLRETKERIKNLETDKLAKQEQIKHKIEEKDEILKKTRAIEKDILLVKDEGDKILAELKKAEAQIDTLRDDEAKLRQKLGDAKVELATLKSGLEARRREDEKLRETASYSAEQIEHDKEELENTSNKISEYKKIQQDEAAKIKELQKHSVHKETEVQVILNERQKLMSDIEKMNTQLHNIRQEAEALKQEIYDLQMDKRSFELQIQNMEKRLSEDYNVKFDEAKDKFKDTVVDEAEITRLKKRIESLGNVNLAAPEEYAGLQERYNFLLTQQQDLEKAKADMHEVIRKINHSTKENFKKTFELVREHFKSIYGKLFEGGTADIILTDESNLLESGVDIIAQPPGKRLQNMSMMALSGGEKALTAIALLFAFFMTRPSPFCILDEADAPLDDANIGRFVSMIKEFSKISQFLIITHNKRTMEMADILYGVTMEEFGVSKVISVRLNKEKMFETGELASAPIN